jgi:hypothetical protein
MIYKRLSSALSVLLIVALLGCSSWVPLRYRSNHPELFTEAIHSLLKIRGFHQYTDAGIEIIEKDRYGRILFSYSEDSQARYLLIAQKADSTYVYYYPDFNFISIEYYRNTFFSEQDILKLKDRNDWNKPLDENKFIKQKIARIKASYDGKARANYKLNENYAEKILRNATGYNGSETIYGYSEYLTSDEYSRKLFYCLGWIPNGGGFDKVHLAIIINADGSYDLATCFMVLKDFYNYQHELKEFKELHNWKY